MVVKVISGIRLRKEEENGLHGEHYSTSSMFLLPIASQVTSTACEYCHLALPSYLCNITHSFFQGGRLPVTSSF